MTNTTLFHFVPFILRLLSKTAVPSLCEAESVISNSACHSNRSKGHRPFQLCVHTLHLLPPHWSTVARLFIQGKDWMATNTLCSCPLYVRYSFLAWTHCAQQPMVSESHLWRPDILSHVWRGPPAALLQLLHILVALALAWVVKLVPGSHSPPIWSTQPSSVQRLPCQFLYPSYRTPRVGKGRLTVPRCLQSLRLISPCSCPRPLSAFQSSKQLEGDPFLLSSIRGKKKSERMRKKEGRPSCWWWWSSGLARSHLWRPGY